MNIEPDCKHTFRTRMLSAMRSVGRSIGFLLTRLLLLPVDIFFLAYDLFSVNLQKSRLTGKDCRGRFADAERGPCPPCWKYTNGFLFRLVCSDMACGQADDEPHCEAGKHVRIYPLRNSFAAAGLAAMIGACVVVGMVYGTRLVRQRRRGVDPGQTSVLYLDHANNAYAKKQYDRAAEYFRRVLQSGHRKGEIYYRLGVCMENLGRSDRALVHYMNAADADEPVEPAVNKVTAELYRRGSFQEAGEYARRGLKSTPEDGNLLAIAADICAREGDLPGAHDRLVAAEQHGADKGLVALARARLSMRQGELEETAQAVESMETAKDWGLPARLCRAEFFWNKGERERAIDELKALTREHPGVVGGEIFLVRMLLAAGHRQEAISRARVLGRDRVLWARAKMRLARLLNEHNLQSEALDIMARIDDFSELAIPANLFAGHVYLQRGLTAQASEHVQKVLNEEPKHPEALFLAGQIALQTGEIDLAASRFAQLPEGHEKEPRAHYFVGRALLAAGRVREALKNLHLACQHKPEDGEYRYALGMALAAKGEMSRARKEMTAAGELLDNPYTAYSRLGWWAEQAGDLDGAVEFYERAIDAAPERAVAAAINLAHILIERDENLSRAQALAMAASVNNRSPRLRADVADILARTLIATGQGESAVVPARRAARARPRDTRRLIRLGIAEVAAGNHRKAESALKSAREQAQSPELEQRAARLLEQLARISHEPTGDIIVNDIKD